MFHRLKNQIKVYKFHASPLIHMDLHLSCPYLATPHVFAEKNTGYSLQELRLSFI